MPKDRYSLQEARQILGVSKSGLEKWLRRARMTATRGEKDMRYYYLTKAQLDTLAEQHDKSLDGDHPDPLTQQFNEIYSRLQELETRVTDLEQERST